MPPSRKETRELDALAQWQIEEIEKGIAEADRGEFASDEEVEQVLKRWTHGSPTGNC
jgi:predicted transcriptional regulator